MFSQRLKSIKTSLWCFSEETWKLYNAACYRNMTENFRLTNSSSVTNVVLSQLFCLACVLLWALCPAAIFLSWVQLRLFLSASFPRPRGYIRFMVYTLILFDVLCTIHTPVPRWPNTIQYNCSLYSHFCTPLRGFIICQTTALIQTSIHFVSFKEREDGQTNTAPLHKYPSVANGNSPWDSVWRVVEMKDFWPWVSGDWFQFRKDLNIIRPLKPWTKGMWWSSLETNQI